MDPTIKYSNYGAYGVEQTKWEGLTRDIQQILRMTDKKSEFHFTEYYNDKDLAPYL